MAKNKKTKSKIMARCECSRCGQVATAQPNTGHFSCVGIHKDIIARLPSNLKGLTNPSKKGTWVPVAVTVAA